MNKVEMFPRINLWRLLLIVLVFAIALMFGLTNAQALAKMKSTPPLKLTVNGNQMNAQAAPFIYEGKVYIPVRELVDELDLQPVWDTKHKKLSLSMPGKRSVIAAPIIKAGTEFVPARVFREAFGVEVTWDATEKIIYLDYSSPYLKIKHIDGTYLLHPQTGDLYLSASGRSVQWLGKTNLSIKSDMVEGVSTGYKMLTPSASFLYVSEMYGEPHLSTDQYVIVVQNHHYTGWLTAVDLKTKKTIRLIEHVATPEQWKVYREELSNDQMSFEFRDWDGLEFVERNGDKVELMHTWFLDESSTRLVTLDLKSLFQSRYLQSTIHNRHSVRTAADWLPGFLF